MALHDRHKEWLTGRGIDPVLAEKLGLETVRKSDGAWLALPYAIDGEVLNHKYRLTTDKRHQMDAGAPLLLWNSDVLREPAVRSGQAPVVITEGEWDAITAIQCGFPITVSVPNGAPATETTDLDGAKRYDWVDRHAGDLAQVKQFIIAADDDEAGHYLRSDLIALLGAERCRFVVYPPMCKDLNEVLCLHGPEAVAHCLAHAKPVPVQGLFRFSDFPEKGAVRHYSAGVVPLADMLYVVPGTLTVMTGFANQGKSTLMNAIIGHVAARHFPVCIASFETDVRPILFDGIRASIAKCSNLDLARMDTAALNELVESRVSIISQAVDEDLEMTLEKLLELCRVAVVRDGCRMIVLDPWNEIEHKRRRDETETDYIGRALRAIKRFAKQYDVAFWIVAHPTKPQMGSKSAPGLYDISGSANWANKADFGVTYHRPKFDENKAHIIISKVRMGYPGKRGEVLVTYDFRTSEFRALEQ